MNLKAVYDKEAPSGNLVTTITGIVTVIISLLVGFGKITSDQAVAVQSQATTIITAGVAIWGAVSGLILVFKAKD